MSFSEWKDVRLGDVITFNPRESISKKQMAKKIAMEKLKPFTKFIDSYELTEFNGGTKFRNGDTLLARITPCLENGKTSQVTILDDNEVGFGSTEYIILREKVGITNKDYIYYLSISPKFRDIAIKSMVGSSGRQRVQQDMLENTEVLLPSLAVQEAIADTLSCLDNKIELNNRINKTLEEMAQAIFKSWFVDFEPFQDGEFEDSELGMIPKGWRVGTIGDYVNVKSGFAFKSAWWKDSGIPVIKIKNIGNNTIDFNDCSFVENDKVDYAKDFKVSGGDLLIAMTGATIGKFAIVPQLYTTMLVNQRVGKFFLGDNPILKIPFIYGVLNLEYVQEAIITRGTGSAQPNISPTALETIKLILPTEEIIEQFNSLECNLFSEIIRNQEENQMLTEMRDSLLPKLMSGEIRVPTEEV